MLIAIIIGFIFWSPLEYFIHRYLGHEWTFQNKFRKEESDLYVLQTGDLNKFSKEIAALNNRYVALKSAEEEYNDESKIGNKFYY